MDPHSALRPEMPPKPVIQRLRERLRTIERAELVEEPAPVLAFGIPSLDAALGGGISCGALHEIAAPHEAALSAATGFALALAARSGKSVVWVAEDLSLAENGTPYGPGLDGTGLAPERLVTVTAPKSRDVLWTMEEALRCPAVGAVIGEIRAGTRDIDTVATRRLSLAASTHGTLALILRTHPGDAHSAAATRWQIGPAPSTSAAFHELGPRRLDARLLRNRRGVLGSWILEWHGERFVLADSQSVAAPSPDRPYQAAWVA